LKRSVNLKWNGFKNVCECCGEDTQTYYIVTGHDHTDESIHLCTCGGGEEPEEVWKRNRWARENCPNFN